MRFYVASRFGEYERTRALIDALTAAGHECTHDWTRTDEFVDGHPKPDSVAEADLPTEVAAQHAQDDLQGVMRAEIVILFHEEGCTGALIEAGAAIATGTTLWVIAPVKLSIFWRLPDVFILPDENGVREALGAELLLDAS